MPSIQLKSLFICLVFCNLLSGQSNYIPYYQELIEIESLTIKEEFIAAEKRILDLFTDYEPNSAWDLLFAAQLCALNEHHYLSLEFLEKAIEEGIEIEDIQDRKVFEPLYKTEKWKRIKSRLSRLQYNYATSINFELSKEFYKRYQLEQEVKGTDKFEEVVEDNFNRIKEVIEQYGFPGEDLIGINYHFAMVTLRNHPYAFSLLQEELIDALEKGKFLPFDFFYVYTYEARKIPGTYRNAAAPPVGIQFPQYDIVRTDEIDEDSLKAERYKLGISPFSILDKKEVSLKYGIRF